MEAQHFPISLTYPPTRSLHPYRRVRPALDLLPSGLCSVTNYKKNVTLLSQLTFHCSFLRTVYPVLLLSGISDHVRWFWERQKPEELPFKPPHVHSSLLHP